MARTNPASGRRIRTGDPTSQFTAWPAPTHFNDEERALFCAYANDLKVLRGGVLQSDLIGIGFAIEAASEASAMRRLANIALAEGDGKEYRALVNAATRARRSHDTALAGLGLRGSERGVRRGAKAAAQSSAQPRSSLWGDRLLKFRSDTDV